MMVFSVFTEMKIQQSMLPNSPLFQLCCLCHVSKWDILTSWGIFSLLVTWKLAWMMSKLVIKRLLTFGILLLIAPGSFIEM